MQIIILIIILLVTSIGYAAQQNLDEVMARKARFSTAAFYSGQTSPNYFWQPETLTWQDTAYSTEVWRVAWNPKGVDVISKEYSNEAWSFDGSRIGFFDLPSTRVTNDPYWDKGKRWILNSDGSKMRAGTGGGGSIDNNGYNWLHNELGYLMFPYGTADFTDAESDKLYKVTIDSDNAMTRSLLLHINDGSAKEFAFKDSITSNDQYLVVQDKSAQPLPTPNPINSYKITTIDLSSNTVSSAWGAARGMNIPLAWGGMTAAQEVFFRGSSSFIVNPNADLYGNYYNVGPHWLLKNKGSASDGGPAWESWNPATGKFGVNEEIKVETDNAASSTGLPHNPYGNGYAGHEAFDRWGHYASIGSSHDCNSYVYGSNPAVKLRWGNGGCPGRLVLDVQNNFANPPWYDANNSNYMIGSGNSATYLGGQHASWTAWSDYNVLVGPTLENSKTLDSKLMAAVIWQNNYKSTNQIGKVNTRAATPLVTTEESYKDNYNSYPRPSQSPDGTKVVFASIMFNSAYSGAVTDDDYVSLAYVVAYYPYPPEIKYATKSGANVRLIWDFNQGTISSPNYSTPRTYTKRGWPDETADLPPSPREINQFRLWSSENNATWTPSGIVAYNNRGGKWTENAWSYDAEQPVNSTRYYALTSLEHSGLESHTLSNVWKVTLDADGNITQQSQATAYPSDPGSKSNFYTTMPVSPSDAVFAHKLAPAISNGQYTITWKAPSINNLIRFYNIYAADGTAPTAIQQRRIASIPASSDYAGTGNFKYVDWLGNIDGSSKYIVTSVDFQGNESPVIAAGAPKSPTGVKGQILP